MSSKLLQRHFVTRPAGHLRVGRRRLVLLPAVFRAKCATRRPLPLPALHCKGASCKVAHTLW